MSVRHPYILIADDHPDNRGLIRQRLAGQYRISEVANGREAIDAIAAERPDLLLLDLQMPVMNGYDVLASLSQDTGPYLPVIVLTADHERSAKLRALSLGSLDVVLLPIDPEELALRVSTSLALQDAQRSVARQSEELRLATARLLQLDRARRRFFRDMTHELRTPLNAISGFAEDALDELAGPLTPLMMRYMTSIRDASRHLIDMSSQFMSLAEADEQPFLGHAVSVNLSELLGELQSTFEPLLKRRQQRLTVAIEGTLPPLRAERAKVLQILLNLSENASKFSDPGTEIQIVARCDAHIAQIAVRDHGMGIAEEDLPIIFDEFRRSKAHHAIEGNGLGLAITKRLVESLGGAIGVSSEEGHGSTFTFTVPLASCFEDGATPLLGSSEVR